MGILKHKRFLSSICIAVLLFTVLIPAVYALDNIKITVSKVSVNAGEDVEIPIILSGNTGIAGMAISVSYNNNLTLKSISRGNALSTLAYTPPGDLTANPVNLVFDGLEEDNTDGTIATLTFTAPTNVTGTFDVNVSYEVGSIYDGDLNDLDVTIINGSVEVLESASTTPTVPTLTVDNLNVGTNTITLDAKVSSPTNISGTVIAALYDEDDNLIKVKLYPAASNVDVTIDSVSGKYIKVMWWYMSTITPITNSVKVDIPSTND